MKRFGIKNVTESEVYAEFMSIFQDEDKAAFETRKAVFDRIGSDFDVEFGKDESKRERNEKGLKESYLTYGEIEFMSIYQAFKWIQRT